MAPSPPPWYGSPMPLDDNRPARITRPAPALTVEDNPELSRGTPPGDHGEDDAHHDEDPQLLAELHRQIEDIEAGREEGIPLEEALLTMFTPYSPEELAELERSSDRRASR